MKMAALVAPGAAFGPEENAVQARVKRFSSSCNYLLSKAFARFEEGSGGTFENAETLLSIDESK